MPASPWGAVCSIIASAMWLPAARMFSAPHHWFVGDGEFGVGFEGRAAAGVALTATAIAAADVTAARRRFMCVSPFSVGPAPIGATVSHRLPEGQRRRGSWRGHARARCLRLKAAAVLRNHPQRLRSVQDARRSARESSYHGCALRNQSFAQRLQRDLGLASGLRARAVPRLQANRVRDERRRLQVNGTASMSLLIAATTSARPSPPPAVHSTSRGTRPGMIVLDVTEKGGPRSAA